MMITMILMMKFKVKKEDEKSYMIIMCFNKNEKVNLKNLEKYSMYSVSIY